MVRSKVGVSNLRFTRTKTPPSNENCSNSTWPLSLTVSFVNADLPEPWIRASALIGKSADFKVSDFSSFHLNEFYKFKKELPLLTE